MQDGDAQQQVALVQYCNSDAMRMHAVLLLHVEHVICQQWLCQKSVRQRCFVKAWSLCTVFPLPEAETRCDSSSQNIESCSTVQLHAIWTWTCSKLGAIVIVALGKTAENSHSAGSDYFSYVATAGWSATGRTGPAAGTG